MDNEKAVAIITYCRGRLPDDVACDCEQFISPPSGLARCTECGHGKSKHPASGPALPVAPLSYRQGPSTSVSGSSARPDMRNMFNLGLNQGSGSVSVDSARREVLEGFRPKLRGQQASTSKPKARKGSSTQKVCICMLSVNELLLTNCILYLQSSSRTASETSGIFHVSGVYILPCGVVEDDEMCY